MFNLKQMLTGGEEGGNNPLGEVKSMLAELTKGKINKSAELDVTKASLVKLSQAKRDILRTSPEQKNILANIMMQVENDFIELDLKRDLGIKDPKKLTEYRAFFKEYFKSQMSNEMLLQIIESQEWEKLNLHINEVAKYTKLDKIIATTKVEGNAGAWTVFSEKHPMIANMGSWIIGWYVGNKNEKNLTKFDKKLLSIGKVLSGEKEKPSTTANKKEEGKEGENAAQPEAEVKLADLDANQKSAIKPLEDAGFTIDSDMVKKDMQYLTEQNLNQEKIVKLTTTEAESASNFYKIGKAILTKLGSKSMKFRLSDVHTLKKLSEDQVSSILKIIEKAEDNPTKMREALDRTKNIKSNDTEDAIAKHLQIKPDAQSTDASPETTVSAG